MNRWVQSVVLSCAGVLNTPQRLYRVAEPMFWLSGHRRLGCPRKPPARLLVIKLDRLGDLVLASPFLRSIRGGYPDARINLVVRDSLVDLAKLCPDVDQVQGVSVTERTMIWSSSRGVYAEWSQQLLEWLRVCQRLGWWWERFDVAIVPRREADLYGAVPLAYVSGANRRISVFEGVSAEKASFNRGFDVLLTNPVVETCDTHEVHCGNPLLEAMALRRSEHALVPWVTDATRREASGLLLRCGLQPKERFICVCMGSGELMKQWPPDRFAEVIRCLEHKLTLAVVTIGARSDSDLGKAFSARLTRRVVNLEGHVALELLPAVMERASLYFGVDTGPMHVAAAAKCPVVMVSCHPIIGSRASYRSPMRFGPWGVPCRVIQPSQARAPCQDTCTAGSPHCILNVGVEEVRQALDGFLDEVSCGW